MSNAREQILNAVRANQPNLKAMPEVIIPADNIELQAKFTDTLTTIGGKVIKASGYADVITYINSITQTGDRVISSITELSEVITAGEASPLPHSLQDTNITVTARL